MAWGFLDNSAARQRVWDRLAAEGVARFPFPPHGRIPNFAGAGLAAARLLEPSAAPMMGPKATGRGSAGEGRLGGCVWTDRWRLGS